MDKVTFNNILITRCRDTLALELRTWASEPDRSGFES